MSILRLLQHFYFRDWPFGLIFHGRMAYCLVFDREFPVCLNAFEGFDVIFHWGTWLKSSSLCKVEYNPEFTASVLWKMGVRLLVLFLAVFKLKSLSSWGYVPLPEQFDFVLDLCFQGSKWPWPLACLCRFVCTPDSVETVCVSLWQRLLDWGWADGCSVFGFSLRAGIWLNACFQLPVLRRSSNMDVTSWSGSDFFAPAPQLEINNKIFL